MIPDAPTLDTATGAVDMQSSTTEEVTHMTRNIPTFADDRDDEFFESICSDEKLAQIRATAQAAWDATFPARSAAFDEKYQASVKAQADRTRRSVRKQYLPHLADGPGLYDDNARTFVAYLPDAVDFLPEQESIIPTAHVYRGVAWSGVEITERDRKQTWTLAELVAELLKTVHPTINYQSPARADLPRPKSHDDSESVVDDRLHMEDEEFDYTQRDEDPALVEHRWNRPADELEILDIIAEEGLQLWNDEILTAFRRAQLHKLCCWYFDTTDYSEKEIVLQWTEVAPRTFRPAVSMNVVEWIESLVEGVLEVDGTWEQKGGTQLSGFYSAAQTIRYKMMRRNKRRVNLHTRILTTSEVRQVAHRAVAAVATAAEDMYFEL